MPRFSTMNKMINCLLTSGSNSTVPTNIGLPLKRRRMGVTSSGSTVIFDDFGEPIVSTTDFYNDLIVYGIIPRRKEVNDEKSNIGGREDIKQKESMKVQFPTNIDVVMNDLLEYPINTNNWYRVVQKEFISGNKMLEITSYHEIRNSY